MSDKHQNEDFWMLMGLFWFMTLAAESDREERAMNRSDSEDADADIEDDDEESDDEECDDEVGEW